MKNIAIIGSGFAGLTLANALDSICNVTVFEKSSGLGGRMATRSSSPFYFDHGAQFFTARTTELKDFLIPFIEKKVVQAWLPKIVTLEKGKKPYKRIWFEPHFIAQPKMTSLAKSIARSINVRFNTQIDRIEYKNSNWSVISKGETIAQGFDWIVSAAAAPQTRDIFSNSEVIFKGLVDIEYSACFALMLGLSSDFTLNFDAALVKNSCIKWIASNSTKVGRPKNKTLVIHTDNEWASQNFGDELTRVQGRLIEELKELIDLPECCLEHIDIHRWRYAEVLNKAEETIAVDSTQRIAACGDWSFGNRIEDAFLSGLRLSEKIVEDLLD